LEVGYMKLIKMTVTDSMGRTYILPKWEEGKELKLEDIDILIGKYAYVYKAAEPSETAEPDAEPQYVKDPYRFWATAAPNVLTKAEAHEILMTMPLGGARSGLYRYPRIGEQVLVAVEDTGGSAEYYQMGYVPSDSNPFNLVPEEGPEDSRRVFEQEGEVLRYANKAYGGSAYSEIGFYQEEKAQWPMTAGEENFPPIDVLVLDSAGNIRQTAWNHHLQKAARIEILAGTPEVLDRKTNAVDEYGTLPLGDRLGDDSSLHRGDVHIRAEGRVVIKAEQEIRLQVGRTVLVLDDTGFNVITRNIAGNYINSYDTMLDMRPRSGISLTGKNIDLKAGYRFNAGDGLGGTVATTMGNLNLGGREIGLDSYNNTEFMFTVLYQTLEYMVNAASGAMALEKGDIKIAEYVNFTQDNLVALIKLARKVNTLWAKRKEIRKQKKAEAEAAAALAALTAPLHAEVKDISDDGGVLDQLQEEQDAIDSARVGRRNQAKAAGREATAAETEAGSLADEAAAAEAAATEAEENGDPDAAEKRRLAAAKRAEANTASEAARSKREAADALDREVQDLRAQWRQAGRKLAQTQTLGEGLDDLAKSMEQGDPEDVVAYYRALVAHSRAALLQYEAAANEEVQAAYRAALANLTAAYENVKQHGWNDPSRDKVKGNWEHINWSTDDAEID
jgi:hypothetical protein